MRAPEHLDGQRQGLLVEFTEAVADRPVPMADLNSAYRRSVQRFSADPRESLTLQSAEALGSPFDRALAPLSPVKKPGHPELLGFSCRCCKIPPNNATPGSLAIGCSPPAGSKPSSELGLVDVVPSPVGAGSAGVSGATSSRSAESPVSRRIFSLFASESSLESASSCTRPCCIKTEE